MRLLGQPKPADANPEGTWYTFEKGVQTSEDKKGWADVWMRDHFGWEYKGKHKDLKAAYQQLQLYREALENPPLMVVCDMDRFEVHTNFTGTLKQKHAFDLAGLALPANLDILRRVFTDPGPGPGITSEAMTVEAAERFAELADSLNQRGIEPLRAAHFLMKLMFCMFGEKTGLLPPGLFGKLLDNAKANPAILPRRLQSLFKAMSEGGDYGNDTIAWFNGGLFADADVMPLTQEEINSLSVVNAKDWSGVEPSIFGTLFERTLDPAKRSQIGAHYTSRADIETLLRPVLVAPLQREWAEVKRKCEEELWPKVVQSSRSRTKSAAGKDSPQRKAFDRATLDFAERLAHVTVLDGACGSGNFLYVAINMLLDLEKEVIAYAATRGLPIVPRVSPTQLHGLEINAYAQQLAQVVIWIGYLQWMHFNGFKMPDHPVLTPIESIKCMDAILDLSEPEHPKEPEWPEAEFIVGNPPFLGGKRMLSELGEGYMTALRQVWDDRLSRFSDLCCYWFEKSRKQIEDGKSRRAGLLATQGIRGGANRRVLERIKKSGDIFFAESDRDWVLDGATVHVSMVGFDNGNDTARVLDGKTVEIINPNLATGSDTTTARALKENAGLSFIGIQKSGPFDIPFNVALEFLAQPSVGGYPSSDVLRPYWTGMDLVRRPLGVWVIDFGVMDQETASRYEGPFEYLKKHVPVDRTAKHFHNYPFWHLWRPRPEMVQAIGDRRRFAITPHVSKHRIFAWAEACIRPSNLLIAVATDKDFHLGVLQSRVHEIWSLAQETQLREKESGNRYTPTTCFETFPFPSTTTGQEADIACPAKELDDLRSRWLNPPEWTKTEVLEFPGSVAGPWARYVVDPDSHGVGTVRWPRVVPKDADCAASLSKRTLTNLYNERPAWLDLTHKKLDAAVFAAYGWNPSNSDDELLTNLLALNLQRAE